jgi:hypothetical protein
MMPGHGCAAEKPEDHGNFRTGKWLCAIQEEGEAADTVQNGSISESLQMMACVAAAFVVCMQPQSGCDISAPPLV